MSNKNKTFQSRNSSSSGNPERQLQTESQPDLGFPTFLSEESCCDLSGAFAALGSWKGRRSDSWVDTLVENPPPFPLPARNMCISGVLCNSDRVSHIFLAGGEGDVQGAGEMSWVFSYHCSFKLIFQGGHRHDFI